MLFVELSNSGFHLSQHLWDGISAKKSWDQQMRTALQENWAKEEQRHKFLEYIQKLNDARSVEDIAKPVLVSEIETSAKEGFWETVEKLSDPNVVDPLRQADKLLEKILSEAAAPQNDAPLNHDDAINSIDVGAYGFLMV